MPSPIQPPGDSDPGAPDIDAVVGCFKRLQLDLCRQLTEFEPAARFSEDRWRHPNGGGGITRVIEHGEVFEKGGVNFSRVRGAELPASASAERADIAGRPFEAAGVSVVMHPRNPFVPCCHMNARFFLARPPAGMSTGEKSVWWFGGGYDLTPYYGFDEDCIHWHQTAKTVCDRFDGAHYAQFKACCDRYFYLKHRGETRGVGGLFFDDYRVGGFARAFAFVQAVSASFIHAYRPIVERRRHTPYSERQRDFQRHRRGRYVEFNLVYDRGTLFGLQSGGRTESILMSMPPTAQWRYRGQVADEPADGHADSAGAERRLVERYLKPRDWLA